MLDTFFSQIKVRSRMESGPIGPHLSEIAAVLHRDGYTHGTIRRHLRAADHFGAWLVKQGMLLTDISTSTVDRYLEGLGRQFYPSRPRGRGLTVGVPWSQQLHRWDQLREHIQSAMHSTVAP